MRSQAARSIEWGTEQALHVLPKLQEPYDIVFIDTDKDEYPTYLEHAPRLTRLASIILADDMLWGSPASRGEKTGGIRGITEYTKQILNDPRLSSPIVPLGDGLALSYRIKCRQWDLRTTD